MMFLIYWLFLHPGVQTSGLGIWELGDYEIWDVGFAEKAILVVTIRGFGLPAPLFVQKHRQCKFGPKLGNQRKHRNSEVGPTNLHPALFDMDSLGGKRVCTVYNSTRSCVGLA